MYDLAVYQRTYEEESQADGKEGSPDIGPYSVRDLFRSEKSKHNMESTMTMYGVLLAPKFRAQLGIRD